MTTMFFASVKHILVFVQDALMVLVLLPDQKKLKANHLEGELQYTERIHARSI